MKKNITVAIFSLFFFSLFISPAVADSEISNLIQQRNRIETLKKRIVTLIDLAESKEKNDVVIILQELLSSARNILGKIDSKGEKIAHDEWAWIRTCATEGESQCGPMGCRECCDGLVSRSVTNPYINKQTGEVFCLEEMTIYVCVNCGDGFCGEGENWCICPEDCKKPNPEELEALPNYGQLPE